MWLVIEIKNFEKNLFLILSEGNREKIKIKHIDRIFNLIIYKLTKIKIILHFYF